MESSLAKHRKLSCPTSPNQDIHCPKAGRSDKALSFPRNIASKIRGHQAPEPYLAGA